MKKLATLLPVGFVSALALVACTVTTIEPTPGGDSDASTPDGGGGGGSSEGGSSAEGGVGGSGCAFGEPNETRETATAIEIGAAYNGLCMSAEGDEDWFELTAPNDAAGGIVQVQVRNVGQGAIRIDPYVVADNGTFIYAYSQASGANVDIWFLTAPGGKYRLKASQFTGTGYAYDLKAVYTKIEDSFEPNDTRETAKPITLGTAISAFHTAGYTTGGQIDAAFEDWYSVDLAAGNATVALSDVPTGVALRLELLDPAGNSLTYELSQAGANVTLTEPVTAGTHKVRVAPFTGTKSSGDEATLPQQVTRPYKLLVTQ